MYADHEDRRITDAARGCLLLLGELPDLPAKVALQATLPQSLLPMLSQPLPEGSKPEPVFDVMLCYKPSDAHTVARMVHTALVLRGIGCLIDYGECERRTAQLTQQTECRAGCLAD
jgi:hypothetical protein